ncbi:MAG TPA: histidine kinase [Jatrophihabitantaceae bacterium]|jgi:signal transduction histidine kinase
MGPAQRLRLLRFSGIGGALRVAGVVGLAALVWATASEHHSDGSPRAPVALLVVTALAWAAWLGTTRLRAPRPVTWLAVAVLAGAGGAVGGLAPVGIAFPAVAVIAAATLVGLLPAVAIAVIGAVSLTLAVLVADSPRAIIAEGVLAIAAALLGGASRRQYQDRAAQAEELLAERTRADAERDRAAALAERNRIGREVHDVLAHSLGALSVQLEATDALLETGGDQAKARELVQQARRIAVDGLSETRKAVHALRDEPVALSEQLAALAATDGAQLAVVGAERTLAPEADLALYRAAQEALSNARKHAPGAPVTLRLDYGPSATALVVANGPCPAGPEASPLSRSGAGLGLRGMRERIDALGGDVSAEPDDQGWTVRVAVPT